MKKLVTKKKNKKKKKNPAWKVGGFLLLALGAIVADEMDREKRGRGWIV